MENESIRTKIQNLNNELGLNFRSFLLDCALKFDKELWNNEEAKSKIWNNSEFMAEKKYRYLLHLFFTSRDEKAGPDGRWLAADKFRKEIEQLINL